MRSPRIVTTLLVVITTAATLLSSVPATAIAAEPALAPTIVLVHGAFADGSSWNGVIRILKHDGYNVIAVANPLRSVHADAQYVANILRTIQSPVVLVGHSYGGSVISEAATGNANVKALVFVAAFAPEAGETVAGLSGKFPGSTLGPALAAPIALDGGAHDLYIRQDVFHAQFAADVSAAEAQSMAAAQRPVTDLALNEASSEPSWRTLPSWFIYGDLDRNIPPQALAFMADRARSRNTVRIKGASHAISVSHPREVATMIREAALAIASAKP